MQYDDLENKAEKEINGYSNCPRDFSSKVYLTQLDIEKSLLNNRISENVMKDNFVKVKCKLTKKGVQNSWI